MAESANAKMYSTRFRISLFPFLKLLSRLLTILRASCRIVGHVPLHFSNKKMPLSNLQVAFTSKSCLIEF